MRNHFTARLGFTLLEIMVVVGLIGLLAALALPYAFKPRTQSQTTICIKNMRQIETGKEQLAFEFHMAEGTPITEASVNTYLKTGNTPSCPASGVYSYNPIGTNPTCNIDGHVLPD
jgi:prepilin-type N-terminal cleavage/methylation domain-containing protein